MSSFSSAYLLLQGLDPSAISLTFDPANMVVEGREDWEFGMQLTRDYIANVHVKNAAWTGAGGDRRWVWSPVFDGMVVWEEMIALLGAIEYEGAFAVEDFLTGRSEREQTVRRLDGIRRRLATICGKAEIGFAA